MKIIKGLAIFSFFSLLLGSCFDPPEFPNTPQIVFERVYFIETPGTSPDSLVIDIKFKDGDGDLGLPSAGAASDPYHPLNYYAGTVHNGSTSDLRILPTVSIEPIKYPLLNLEPGGSGKLVTFDMRESAEFSSLPAYEGLAKCINYTIDTVAVFKDDSYLIDETYNVVDTADIKATYNNEPITLTFYYVADTFYVTRNPNYYNIEVDFLVYDPTHPEAVDGYYEYDWVKNPPDLNTCGQTFDSRFPVLSETDRALDGTLTYAMESRAFRKKFGNNILRLRVQIKDQALNLSNTVMSPPFTLDEIKE